MLLNKREMVFREQHTGGASGGTTTAMSGGGHQAGVKEQAGPLLEQWQLIRNRCEKLPNWNEMKTEFDRFDAGLNNFISRFGGNA